MKKIVMIMGTALVLSSCGVVGAAGSIAGAKFGYESIPKRWIEKLDKEVAKKLEEFLEYIFKTYGGSI